MKSKSEKSFKYEWNFYALDEYQKDYYKSYVFECLGEKPAYFKDKRVLDIGCGVGRMAFALIPYCKEFIALDLTDAVYNIPDRDNLVKIKDDILKHNFIDKFDFIFARGVFHHLKNPREGYNKAYSLLKKDGVLVFGFYPKKGVAFNIVNSFLRFFTTKLPHSWLYKSCKFFAPVVPTAYILRNGKITRPLTLLECTWLLFDWFSPQYQHHLSEEEVNDWLCNAEVIKNKKGYRKIKRKVIRSKAPLTSEQSSKEIENG